MKKQKIILLVIILLLIASNVYFGFNYLNTQKELCQTKATLEAQATNEKVLDFTKLFITEVLKSETEIDFEARLKLENAVRNLDDEEILAQWQKFTESETETEAQEEVKNLLEMLAGKIKIQ